MKKTKTARVMHEYKHGALHSGSKSGAKVTSRKQAVAIALSEARKSGEKVGKVRGAKSRRTRDGVRRVRSA